MSISVSYFNSTEVPEEANFTQLKCNNWSREFPYCPDVKIKLWHNDKSLFIHFKVEEDFVAAKADKNNGEVWKDSCVELFISFDDNGYYNIETNCIGKILMSHREGRKINVKYAGEEIIHSIKRITSLGTDPIPCRKNFHPWELTLEIPAKAFFKHNMSTLGGVSAKCNIYKCGDDLPSPHFISLFPIDTEKPDFHRPEFFQQIFFLPE